MVKVLYVTAEPLEYNSSANIRNWGLVEGLHANGVAVYTLCPYPTDRKMFNGVVDNRSFVKRYWIGASPTTNSQITENTEVKYSKIKMRLKKIGFDLFNYLSVYDRRRFLRRKIDAGLIDENFDYIISSSDPKSAHLFVEELYKQRPTIGKKWIQYWGDPFTNDVSDKKLFGNLLVEREERRLLAMADKVVYVSPFTVNAQVKRYPSFDSKIVFLPIPYRISNNNTNSLSYDKGLVGYFGDYHSKYRDIIPFYNAVKQMELKVNIIGNSDLSLSPTDNINVKGRVPVQELEDITNKTHIFVCICNLHGTQIPGKVYHYVNSGKPILVILDGDRKGELKEYFDSFERFYICENTQESIISCIQKIIKEDRIFQIPDLLNPQTIASKFLE